MAAVLLSNTMAQNNTTNADDDTKPTILHDFLGRECAPPTKFAAASDGAGGSSPSASGSGGGGRGGGPVSSTSDLGSDRQGGMNFEGFFCQKSDLSGSMIRYSGSKRSNADSAFIAPSREGIPHLRPDFPETSHLMKMLRNVGTDRSRWAHEDESFMGMNQMRPTASSLMVQPPTVAKTDAKTWDRAIPVNVGPVLQYPPRSGQSVPYGYQSVSNRFKDTNVGSSLNSHLAADEGSRTGIKGSGILTSVNVNGAITEPISSINKSLITNTEAGSSTTHLRQGSSSSSRQMTIFYGGQAHVFDDVHPNKADVIMALAGSNGGSWSTSFLPSSAVKPSSGEPIPGTGEHDAILAGKSVFSSKDIHGRSYAPGNSSHGLGSSDRMLMLHGGQGSILTKDPRVPMQGSAEQKREEKR